MFTVSAGIAMYAFPFQFLLVASSLLCRGNVLELLDDIQELSPHMFVSVPRLFNRIYDRVNATIRDSNPISRKLFETAYASKKAALDRGDLSGGRMGAFWDKLVFSKIKARLGGKKSTAIRLSNINVRPIFNISKTLKLTGC